MNNLPSQIFTKTIIAQASFSPSAVLDKASGLQTALNWGLGVSSFFISMMMLAAFLRYVLSTNKN